MADDPNARLVARATEMLATYERRDTTNVPGTISLIRDLAAALRPSTDEPIAAPTRPTREQIEQAIAGALDGGDRSPVWIEGTARLATDAVMELIGGDER